MTEQEAIKELKTDSCLYCCWGCHNPSDCIVDCDYSNATDMAIEALEKQIPKTPYFEGDGEFNGEIVYDTWRCPSCNKGYEVDIDEYDYCPNCGQALKWE